MTLPDLDERAARAVAQLSDDAVRRITAADPNTVVIAVPCGQEPDDETISALRHLVHRLCKERIAEQRSGANRDANVGPR